MEKENNEVETYKVEKENDEVETWWRRKMMRWRRRMMRWGRGGERE